MKKKILTGLKPTGELTLGNYIGAIKQMVDMQDEYKSYIFIADLHAITIAQDPKELKDRIRKFVAMYMACGIDFNKNKIYLQSENPYIPAISWLLECTSSFGDVSRMIQFKEKSKGKENFSVGLFTYPVLMASDILYLDTDIVPVGIDQKQHVELTRKIAGKFNNKYGETFKIPEPLIRENGLKIKDLRNPENKMSKSEENPNGTITLFDTEKEIIKKIKSATTDSEMKVKFDMENKPGISNLINICVGITNLSVEEIEKKFEGKNYGEFKSYVAEVVCEFVRGIQEKYEEIINSDIIDKVLEEGRIETTKIAKEKYEDMLRKLGLVRK